MGRKIKIKPIMSQTLTVYSGDYPTQAGVVFKAENKEQKMLIFGKYLLITEDSTRTNKFQPSSQAFTP